KGISFPVTNRGSEEFWIRILRQRASVRIDMAHFRVGFNDDRELTRSHEKFHRIRLIHDSGHAWRQAVRCAVVFWLWLTGSRGAHRFILRRKRRSSLPTATGSTLPTATCGSTLSARALICISGGCPIATWGGRSRSEGWISATSNAPA